MSRADDADRAETSPADVVTVVAPDGTAYDAGAAGGATDVELLLPPPPVPPPPGVGGVTGVGVGVGGGVGTGTGTGLGTGGGVGFGAGGVGPFLGFRAGTLGRTRQAGATVDFEVSWTTTEPVCATRVCAYARTG